MNFLALQGFLRTSSNGRTEQSRAGTLPALLRAGARAARHRRGRHSSADLHRAQQHDAGGQQPHEIADEDGEQPQALAGQAPGEKSGRDRDCRPGTKAGSAQMAFRKNDGHQGRGWPMGRTLRWILPVPGRLRERRPTREWRSRKAAVRTATGSPGFNAGASSPTPHAG